MVTPVPILIKSNTTFPLCKYSILCQRGRYFKDHFKCLFFLKHLTAQEAVSHVYMKASTGQCIKEILSELKARSRWQ